jgi:hypothetical protein
MYTRNPIYSIYFRTQVPMYLRTHLNIHPLSQYTAHLNLRPVALKKAPHLISHSEATIIHVPTALFPTHTILRPTLYYTHRKALVPSPALPPHACTPSAKLCVGDACMVAAQQLIQLRSQHSNRKTCCTPSPTPTYQILAKAPIDTAELTARPNYMRIATLGIYLYPQSTHFTVSPRVFPFRAG